MPQRRLSWTILCLVQVSAWTALVSPARAQTGGESSVGYIDSAIPRSEFRLRFDAAYNDNRPDRAEFFYPKCGCFQDSSPPQFRDPKAPGPEEPETRVDYQELSAYLEQSFGDRFSAFVEVPVRFINPEQNPNASGLSDINAGFKYAFIADPKQQYLTFQWRTYTPTGQGNLGLGTDHVSLEPALLGYQRLTDRLTLEAELRDWIPIGGTDFAGNVVRYGIGCGYDIYQNANCRISPVTEFVGWTVLSGKGSSVEVIPISAVGDTIVNVKTGVRVAFDDRCDLYAGYGRALTGDVWYKQILRLEFRLFY